jgi:DNA-binding response OmpR family regulator
MNALSFDQCVLIVEDDRRTSQRLAACLAREGFNSIAASEGRQALELASRHRPMFVLMDVMLPDVDGWEICRRLRNASSVPIMILSALGEAHDRIRGLTLGADDYVVKPFCHRELIARIRAILRRAGMRPSAEKLSHGDIAIDTSQREVIRKGQRVALTSSEFKILEVLMAVPGRVFLRRELLSHLYPSGGVVIERVIDVHVRKLRQKIEDEPSSPRYVLTARGLGYRFAAAAEIA